MVVVPDTMILSHGCRPWHYDSTTWLWFLARWFCHMVVVPGTRICHMVLVPGTMTLWHSCGSWHYDSESWLSFLALLIEATSRKQFTWFNTFRALDIRCDWNILKIQYNHYHSRSIKSYNHSCFTIFTYLQPLSYYRLHIKFCRYITIMYALPFNKLYNSIATVITIQKASKSCNHFFVYAL